ncbi:MAG: M48 family metallopeptidase [bacterium]|nr:M48 family metallopeptidase [bacterium]
MNAQIILTIFIVFFIVEFLFSLYLDFINLNFISINSKKIPEYLRGEIDEDTYRKSTEYSRAKLKFGMFMKVVDTIIIFPIIVLGGLGWWDSLIHNYGFEGSLRGVLYFLSLSLVFYVLGIPAALYSTFVLEEKFGFNTMTFKTWIFDQIKSLIISGILFSLLLSGLFWFMSATGDLWWVWAFIFVATIQLTLVFVYPILLAPLFNKFTPLSDDGLKEKILSVAKLGDFKAEGIFIMDGSKRSKHANAYFTGFGKIKRIVLFDTLIKALSESQILSVLAHEIGHEKLGHMKKGLALSLVMLFITFFFISIMMNYMPFFEAFGFESNSNHAGLAIFSFASAPITFWLGPLFASLSRKHEYEADRFAAKIMGTFETLKAALIKLSKESLANFTPHPLYSFFHYSHPTLSERIKAMESSNGNK